MMRATAVPLLQRVLATTRRPPSTYLQRNFSSANEDVFVSETKATTSGGTAVSQEAPSRSDKEVLSACGDVAEDDEMEQEEMFVDPHASFNVKGREWGGPTRGGRLLEPTRFGDWERKGRCSDF